jgi:SAM-dependent methyltransferase
MAKKKTVPSPSPDSGDRSDVKPVSASEVMSPAAGVRALRRRIEARRAGGSEHDQRALEGVAAVLARLETDYGETLKAPPPVAVAAKPRLPRVAFMPTPPRVVTALLKLAGVTSKDVVYDLGCGDGRIVIAAVARHGARGVGIDDDPQRIKDARSRAARRGVGRRLRFIEADLFTADIRGASVVTLYLLPSVNLALRPRLLSQLEPGTRIVSHDFDMGDWPAARSIEVEGRRLYCWIVPQATPARTR